MSFYRARKKCKSHCQPTSCKCKQQTNPKSTYKKPPFKFLTLTTTFLLIIQPTIVLASETTKTFENVYHAVMNIFDAGVVVIIIFSGAAWALGHRTKALELLIGVCCGYLLARHAIDIRDFLRAI